MLKGPFEGRGRLGMNDVKDGIIQTLEQIPSISKYVDIIKLLIPDIPSSPYRYYVVSADFNTIGGVVSEDFQIEFYEDGQTRAYCRGGIFENN